MPFNRPAAMRALHALGRQHGYTVDDLRDMAASHFGIPRDKVSLRKLTDGQLGTLCATLKGDNKGPQPVSNKATTRQIWKINQLATLLGMRDGDGRLSGFIHRQVKKQRLDELTKRDAVKVIDGLKTIHDRNSDVGFDTTQQPH